MVGPKVEGGQKLRDTSVINQIMAIWANCCRSCCLVSWIGGWSWWSDLLQVWLPGLVAVDHVSVVAADGGSEFSFCVWAAHDMFLYSTSHFTSGEPTEIKLYTVFLHTITAPSSSILLKPAGAIGKIKTSWTSVETETIGIFRNQLE